MKKILIVEDDITTLSMLDDNLTKEGFKIIRAVNGKEGLEIALREHPDLILLDILMPVMDGITMLKKLRKDPWGEYVKVIILTNLSDNESVAEVIEQGSCDYFVKSFCKIEDIVTKVRERIGD